MIVLPSVGRLAEQQFLEHLGRGGSDPTGPVQERPACPIGRDQCPVRSTDLMVPRTGYPAQLDQAAGDDELVTVASGRPENEILTDHEAEEVRGLHSCTGPTGARGRPKDGVFEPLEDRLRSSRLNSR